MTHSHSTFNDLPTELVHEILRLTLKGCPSGVVQNVLITSPSQLNKFYNSVTKHPQLGKKVKTLDFNIHPKCGRSESRDAGKVIKWLLFKDLPNLKEIKEVSSKPYDAFLSELHTAYCEEFWSLEIRDHYFIGSEPANIVTEVVFSNDEVEEIKILELKKYDKITDDEFRHTGSFHSDLTTFDKFTTLLLNVGTQDDFRVLEYVTTNCKCINRLSFGFVVSSFNESSSKLSSTADMPSFRPAPNIRALDCVAGTYGKDHNLMYYIMHKFPQLHELNLGMERTHDVLLDSQILTMLLNYAHNIQRVSLSHFSIDPEIMVETIFNYWSATAETASRSLRIVINETLVRSGVCQLDISHGVDRPDITIYFPPTKENRDYLGFLEKNGKFLKSLEFECAVEEDFYPIYYELPDDFLLHALTLCPNLRKLRFYSCILKSSSHTLDDLRIDELHLDRCKWDESAPLELTMAFSVINHLRITKFMKEVKREEPRIFIKANDVGLITLKDKYYDHLDEPEVLRVRVYAENPEELLYYIFDEGMYETDLEEYRTVLKGERRITIMCYTMPEIDLDCDFE